MLILTILSVLVWIATVVVFIMVLIKLFQNEGTGKGILGLICALYTFIWGWQKREELGITQLMMIWSGLIVAGVILNSLAQVLAQ